MKPFWMTDEQWKRHLEHQEEIRERFRKMREDTANLTRSLIGKASEDYDDD